MSKPNLQTTNLRQPRYDGQSSAYLSWREKRLHAQFTLPKLDWELTSDLDTPGDLHAIAAMCQQVHQLGFAGYRWDITIEKQRLAIAKLAEHLGLSTTDSGVIQEASCLSLLEDLSGTARGRFLPYSNKAMNWHTDGYYNAEDNALHYFTLHCLQPAFRGGTLTVMDPELLLIALYDDNPQLVYELTHRDAMLLPSNADAEGHDRPDRSVPVFFAHDDGTLGLRFTMRTKHIQWRTSETKAAADRAVELINANTQWHCPIRLESGQGVIARNVLHSRDAFEDAAEGQFRRRMLRGRYPHIPALDSQGALHAARQ